MPRSRNTASLVTTRFSTERIVASMVWAAVIVCASPATLVATDCNNNGVPDETDITECPPADASCQDCNGNGLPDECDMDRDGDGLIDECDTCPDSQDVIIGEDGCPIPYGPCCVDDTLCVDNRQADDCRRTGGTYLEDGLTCDADPDGDGITGCQDLCPFDRQKQEPGTCGCSAVDRDADYDGIVDCIDLCPESLAGVPINSQGCTALGSCCFLVGVCFDGFTPDECASIENGVYQGDGTSCDQPCRFPGNGDYDANGEVDLEDYIQWDGCMTGPGSPITEQPCEVFDLDGLASVDLLDFGLLQRVFNGPIGDGTVRLVVDAVDSEICLGETTIITALASGGSGINTFTYELVGPAATNNESLTPVGPTTSTQGLYRAPSAGGMARQIRVSVSDSSGSSAEAFETVIGVDPAECADGDGCTSDYCVAGFCLNEPIVCGPGQSCNPDSAVCEDDPCTSNADCDDGLFCTGGDAVADVCDPTNPDAGTDGCVRAGDPCGGVGRICDEANDACAACVCREDLIEMCQPYAPNTVASLGTTVYYDAPGTGDGCYFNCLEPGGTAGFGCSVSCSPPSGSWFELGVDTTVTCTSDWIEPSEPIYGVDECSFTVTVDPYTVACFGTFTGSWNSGGLNGNIVGELFPDGTLVMDFINLLGGSTVQASGWVSKCGEPSAANPEFQMYVIGSMFADGGCYGNGVFGTQGGLTGTWGIALDVP